MINFTHTEGALSTSLVISLVAAILTIFGWIRFSVTAILLLIALALGLIVAKQNILNFDMNSSSFSKENMEPLNSMMGHQEKMNQMFEGIREEMEQQNQTIKTLTHEIMDVRREQELLKKEIKHTSNQDKSSLNDTPPQIPFPISP